MPRLITFGAHKKTARCARATQRMKERYLRGTIRRPQETPETPSVAVAGGNRIRQRMENCKRTAASLLLSPRLIHHRLGRGTSFIIIISMGRERQSYCLKQDT